MGQMHHMPQEYFQEFDPEKFAEQIKSQAAGEAAEAAENEAGESVTGEGQDGRDTDD